MKKMQISIFQKVVALCVMAMMSVQLNAQARIELNSGFRGNQISESTLKGFETTFSYNAIETENVETVEHIVHDVLAYLLVRDEAEGIVIQAGIVFLV